MSQNVNETASLDNDTILLVDILRRLYAFWLSRRLFIIGFILAGLAFGGIAAAFFNPWLVQLNIRNVDDFFDFNSLKSVQSSLRASDKALTETNSDPILAKKVQSKLETPNWIEQNITPEFSVSKAELRSSSLPDQAQTALAEKSQFLFLRIQVTDADATEAEKQGRLIANLTTRLVMKEQFLSFFTQQAATMRREIEQDSKELAVSRENLAAVERQLFLAKGVADRMAENGRSNAPGQVSVQSQLAVGAGETVFFPIDIQVSGLEIQRGMQMANLERWSFRFALHKHLLTHFSGAIDQIVSDQTLQKFMVELSEEAYWRFDQPMLSGDASQSVWMADYASDATRNILFQTQSMMQRYGIVANNFYLISLKKLYYTATLVSLGFLFGIFIIFILFLFDAGGNLISRSSDPI